MNGSVIRAYRPEDEPVVQRLVTEAFGDHGPTVARLVGDLRQTHVRAELVAEEAGVVAGHVLLSRSWVDAREQLVEVLVLSPLAVAPERQGRGIGGTLVAAAIAEAGRLGFPALFLEGSPAYYGPRGFEPATAHGFTAPSARVPPPGFQVVLLESHEPWMTGALVYGEPFWSHDCVGLRGARLAEFEQVFGSLT